MQVTRHDVPVQLTRSWHVLTPVQATVVVGAWLSTVRAHARAPAQSTPHALPTQRIACVHESAFSHLMSHEDASHVMSPVQLPAPLQPTLQSLPLHAVALVHDPAPTQSIVQALARAQSMPAVQEPAPVHVTAHGMPGGHTTGAVHVPAATQSMAQVPPSSQVPIPASPQSAGQTAAASRVRASVPASPASASAWPCATAASPQDRFASWIAESVGNPFSVSIVASPVPRMPRPQPTARSGRSSAARPRVKGFGTHVRVHFASRCQLAAIG